MSVVVTLAGDRRTPEFLLPSFGFNARHRGKNMKDWVKSLPDRRWDSSAKRWFITGTGGTPVEQFLAQEDLVLDRSEDPADLHGVDLMDLFAPKLRIDPRDPANVQIRPMLVGRSKVEERVGPGAVWDPANRWLNAPPTELFEADGSPKRGLSVSQEMVDQVSLMRSPTGIPAEIEASASALATHIGSEDEGKTLSPDAISHLRVVSSHTGRLPEWFGLALFPFQECGAYSVAAGHNLLADEPGLGKGGILSGKILTPSGWTTYGKIQPGDMVIGSDGAPTRVSAIFPRGTLPVFTVSFDDGSSTTVDGEHLWRVKSSGGWSTLETQALAKHLAAGRTFDIPLVEAVDFTTMVDGMEAGADSRICQLRSLIGDAVRLDGDGVLWVEDECVKELICDVARSLGGVVRCEGLMLELLLPDALDAEVGITTGAPRRSLVAIEPAGVQEVVCISVTAQDSLYVTDDFLLTHNTRTSLAAAAIRKASRVVVVCPPLVLTNWGREIRSAFEPGIHIPGTPMYRPAPEQAPEPKTKAARKKAEAAEKKAKKNFPEWISVIRAGRKVPPLPETGFVVVPDSLLSSRPELLAELIDWAPEAAIFDEVHRARTWTSKRATACRTVASSVLARGGLTVPTTGTPILASPLELLNLLAMTGHLYRGWGSAGAYIERYLRPQKFGGFAPRKKELPGLGDVLRQHVWTRRNKKDVLTQLPPKWRTVRRVEIDEKPFKEAHSALYEKLSAWVDEFQAEKGSWPAKDDIDQFVHGRAIELMSPLRVAAGVAKIPAATEIIQDWMETTTIVHADGTKEYTRPLLVWAHHKEVLDAMANALPKELADVGVISGATSSERRQELADQFQAGKLGVLVCSIIAAGFGLTLTRSSDAIFIEQDWTPAQISQAEDRISRIGQDKPCMITTLYADNTLDPSLRAVLMNKGDILEAITPGSDNRVTKVTAIETEDSYEEFTGEDVELARSVKNTDEIVTAIVEHILLGKTKHSRVAA